MEKSKMEKNTLKDITDLVMDVMEKHIKGISQKEIIQTIQKENNLTNNEIIDILHRCRNVGLIENQGLIEEGYQGKVWRIGGWAYPNTKNEEFRKGDSGIQKK